MIIIKNKIYNLLNLLVDLTSKSSISDLENEKNKMLDEIDLTRKKINDLTKLMETNRYFDESAEILDKNTVVALQKKVKKLQSDEEILKTDLKKSIEDEKFYKEKIELGKENVDKYKELLKNISYKLVDKNVNLEYYNHLQSKNEERLDYWNNFVRKLEKELASKDNNSDILKSSKDNFEYEIKNLKQRILEINKNLENELNYFNHGLKQRDEIKLNELNKKIEKLEKEFEIMVTSVPYLANDFINLVNEESYIYAHSKLNEIIWEVEKVPYALITDYEMLIDKLKILKKEKNNLKEKIKNNDYLNEKSKYLKIRLKDIYYFLEENKKQIIEVKKTINYIDKEKVFELSSKINDLNLPEEMIANYNSDLNHLIEYSILLKNTSLKYLESYRKKLNEELDDISKKLALKDGLVDEDKKLKDIEKIKELSFDIDCISHRLDNKLDVYNIKETIDMLLDSIDFEYEIKTKTKKTDLIYLKVVEIILPEDDIIDLTGV